MAEPRTRREQIICSLAARIRSGELQDGERLGSEAQLAAEYGASRGTIRQALQELQQRELIATRAGLGSFVTFDGVLLDAQAGWARALLNAGVTVTTELLGIDPPAAAGADLPGNVDGSVVTVHRRRLLKGDPVSYERATVPAHGSLSELATTGLVDDSLTATLRQAGLIPHHGTQRIDVSAIDEHVGSILRQPLGSPVLHTKRTSYDRSGYFVEHVESYLDPEHFSLVHSFGEESQ